MEQTSKTHQKKLCAGKDGGMEVLVRPFPWNTAYPVQLEKQARSPGVTTGQLLPDAEVVTHGRGPQ